MSATNRGAKRRDRDLYATPEWAFKCLAPFLPMESESNFEFCDPACGDGRIVHWLRTIGEHAHGSDIAGGHDFLTSSEQWDCIITNPPYSLAFEFCQHAVKQAAHVFLLLRLNFLASGRRQAWFQKHEPAALFVLSRRPSFTENGETDNCDYAWFYWGDRNRGIFHL